MTLFYVDDDQDDVEIFIDALRSIDPAIICHTAIDSDDALAWLDGCSVLPDFIVLDINMPKLNGIEFLAELRQHRRYQQMPAILYSTGQHNLSLLQQQKLGIIRSIRKQADYFKLCRELKLLLVHLTAATSKR